MQAEIYDIKGNKKGTVALDESIFGVRWNADLVTQVVNSLNSSKRKNIAHAKTRGEVRGGGKKPWKQKGTGRARHGSNRSPIWRGGGVTHGPRAEKDYSVKINRKMRLAALKSVLARKWADGEIVFVSGVSFAAPKTKDAKAMLVSVATASGNPMLAQKRKNAAVIALPSKDASLEKSLQNIGSIITEEVRNLNPVDLMTKKYLVITNPSEALIVLENRFAAK